LDDLDDDRVANALSRGLSRGKTADPEQT